MSDNIKKIKFNFVQFKAVIKTICRYQKFLLLTMFIKIFIGTAATFPMIIFPKYIIDEMIKSDNFTIVIILVLSMIVISLAVNTISIIISNKEQNMCEKLNHKLSVGLQIKSLEIDYDEYLETDTQNKMFQAFNIVDGNNFFDMLNSITRFATSFFTFIGIIAIVAGIDVILLLASIVMIIIQGVITSLNTKKNIKFREECFPYMRRSECIAQYSVRTFYRKDILVYGAKDYIVKKLNDYMSFVFGFFNKMRRIELKGSLINNFAATAFQFLTYALLGFKVFYKTITIGDFTMYMSALNTFVSSCNNMVSSIIDIGRRVQYFYIFDMYMNMPSKFNKGEKSITAEDVKGLTIEFENVSFKYPGSENYALKNINIKINSNEKLAVVGENGAGKTTFIMLLSRLYDPTEGRILLNGTDIKEIKYEDYMKLFSTVFQDFQIFAFSLLENIIFEKNISDKERKEIKDLIDENGLGGRLKSLKKGMDTYITKDFDPEGEDLSGGEKQKLAIIRSLYKNAPIIVLDEPTAALDPNAEYEIYKKFADMIFNKTAVYISHRIASTRFCDRITVFENGQITECGTFEELLSNRRKYFDMYNKQAQYFEEKINIVREKVRNNDKNRHSYN